jgi:hypothetical protein
VQRPFGAAGAFPATTLWPGPIPGAPAALPARSPDPAARDSAAGDAGRALALGTVITTNQIRCEREVKALLGMPIGYPEGKFGPVTRLPVQEVAYRDRWGAAWPG